MPSRVTRQELASIIADKTMHIKDRRDLAQSIAAYFAGEHTSVDLDSLVRDVMLLRQAQGIIEAMAVSAHELTPTVMQDIEDLLTDHFPGAKSILVDSRIDPSVVGGIRIELPNEVLDLSVKSKLNTLKRLVAEERN